MVEGLREGKIKVVEVAGRTKSKRVQKKEKEKGHTHTLNDRAPHDVARAQKTETLAFRW